MVQEKRVGIVTFHASHNYGSVLQAYALQNIVNSFCDSCEIINFRTLRQIDLYTIFTKRKGLRYFLKNMAHLLYYFPLKKRYNRFEEFINNKLILSEKTYFSNDDLEQVELNYSIYIAGSDQIWNPVITDFDWAYFLSFVKNGKCISYAPSFGQLAQVGDKNTQEKIAKYLRGFNTISVRDKCAKENVYRLVGVDVPILLDPTLLLDSTDWDRISSPSKIKQGHYIFLYTLFANKEIIDIAQSLSKKTGLPVVTSNFSNQYDVFSTFKKYFDTGPCEFITLIRNARLVLSTSYHGVVFSVLYHKPFLAIHGNTDARISTFLTTIGLSERSVEFQNINEKLLQLFAIDFSTADIVIDRLREESIMFLKNAVMEAK